MPFTSPFPDLQIPKVNILTYLFPTGKTPSAKPLWIDSKDLSISLSPSQLLRWVKRLAFGLERIGLKKGDVVMIYTPNHIFVPVAYLGIVGAGYAFSGANPVYTLPGKFKIAWAQLD
jgi:acyl-CoA synthetase (AMP-forming)/AMP-acid ligase II